MVFVLSVPFKFTTFDYPFGIYWSLYCLYLLDLRLLITPLVSIGLCIVCTFEIYDFWLPLWYLLAFVLSVPFRFTTFDYPFGINWSLYCLYLLDLRLLITPLVSIGLCIVCTFRFTAFDYPFGIYWSLYCLYLLDLRLLITPLVSIGLCIVCTLYIYDFWLPLWYLLVFVLSVPFRFTLLITPLVSIGLCIVCTFEIYDFWLPLWNLLVFVLSVPFRFTTFDYLFGIYWSLYCLYLLDLRLLITPLVSIGLCIVCTF